MLSSVNGTEFNGSCTLNMQSTQHTTQEIGVLSVLHRRTQNKGQFGPKSFILHMYEWNTNIYTPLHKIIWKCTTDEKVYFGNKFVNMYHHASVYAINCYGNKLHYKM